MSATFITPVDVTPTIGSGSGWVNVDVSAYVPAGATGVILHHYSSISSWLCGVRKEGSTDDRTTDVAHQWMSVGVDASRIFEAFVYAAPNNYSTILLIGYYDSDAYFFVNAANKSTANANSWQTVDISADTGANTAIGAFLELVGSTTYNAVRMGGSNDNRYTAYTVHRFVAIGVNGTEIFETYINSANSKCYLMGYITANATFNANANDLSLGSANTWTDLTALPANAVGAMIEAIEPGYSYYYGLRKKGSNEEIFKEPKYTGCGIVECDANRVIEGKISSTTFDFYLTGYFIANAAPPSNLAVPPIGERRASPIFGRIMT